MQVKMLHLVLGAFVLYLFLLRSFELVIPLVLWVFAFTWAIYRDVKDEVIKQQYRKFKYGRK